MSAAVHLLASLRSAGLRLGLDEGRLWVEPASLLTPELLTTIRQHKPALLTLLSETAGIGAGSPAEPPPAPRPTEPARRPFGLTAGELNEAHREAWTAADTAKYIARVATVQRRGFAERDGEDLAERLHLLDVQSEGLVLCLGCRHLSGTVGKGWRCGNHRAAGMPRELSAEVVTLPQRCTGFNSTTEVKSC